MSYPIPKISLGASPHICFIEPNALALQTLSTIVWECAQQYMQRPLVVLGPSAPLAGIRIALERYRPNGIDPAVAFLPQVISFNDWLELAPEVWKLPRKQSPLERWLSVYSTLKQHPKLQAWFNSESEAGAWGLAKAIISACDTLSNAVSPSLQEELASLINSQEIDNSGIGEAWVERVEILLEEKIAEAYPKLARKVVDQEAKILLTFWRYISSANDPTFRKQLAMAAHLTAAKERFTNCNQNQRPFIWVEVADSIGVEREINQKFLSDYARYAPVIKIGMDWNSVALWAEAVKDEGECTNVSGLIQHNIGKANYRNWRLISVKRFEELAWIAAKVIEENLIAGKRNIALVAQDRLAARRVRALLGRLGPSLNIRDETGWKLSTTRAAAAFNSWLELLKSPKEGPAASILLEFLKNPFIDIERCLRSSSGSCDGLVAELEDILVASRALSGWETFYLAIEGAKSNAGLRGAVEPNPALIELLQFVRSLHHAWLQPSIDFYKAYEQLHSDFDVTGMAQQLLKDSAGKQLLEVFKSFNLNSIGHRSISMRPSEWISLLKNMIEEANYQEVGLDSHATLSILPLSSTRLREFEAIVVVGCDEQQLPAFSEPPLFFSDALNRLLKAPTIRDQFIQQSRDLSQLLASCVNVALVWQNKSESGEALRPSAWIQRLQMELSDWRVENIMLQKLTGDVIRSEMSVATLSDEIPMPISMSPSAYKALRDCPYRYYVNSFLGLRKTKGFDEGFDASLVGQTLHRILRIFYQALKTEEHKTDSKIGDDLILRRDWMQQKLIDKSEQEFKRLIEGDARVLGVLRDWQKQIPGFVGWQLKREAIGWKYLNGEVKVGFDMKFKDQNGMEKCIRIEGFVDRLDIHEHDANFLSVIDYKNQSIEKIKLRADHIVDDPQLLIYARAVNEEGAFNKLSASEVKQAEWVSLKADSKNKGEVNINRAVEVACLTTAMEEFSNQLIEDIEQLWTKKPLQAFAPDGICKYCEYRGICRKGMW